MFVTAENFDIPPFNITKLDNVINTFEDYVDTQEETELVQLLGVTLYDAMVEGLAITPTIPARWLALRDGATYTYQGKEYRWDGLVEMLTPFIFSQWVGDRYKHKTDLTVVEASVENGKAVSPADDIVRAYNKYSTIAGGICKLKNSLYGYLYTSGETFLADIGDEYINIEQYLSEHWNDPGTINVFNI